MPRIATLVTLVALLGALLGVGTACGDGGDPQAAPSASPTDAASTATPTEPTESSEPTEPTGPTVEPADGPILDKLTYATVNAPQGWHVLDQLIPMQQEAGREGTGSVIILAETENLTHQAYTLDHLVDVATRPERWPRRPKVLPTTELDGVEVYHIAGQVERPTYFEEFGVSADDWVITLQFQFDSRVSPEARQEVIDATVASFRWKKPLQR